MGLLSKLRQTPLLKRNVQRRTPAPFTSRNSGVQPGTEESPTHANGCQEVCSSSVTRSSSGICSEAAPLSSSVTPTWSVTFPVVGFVRDEKPDTPIQPAFISLSSDLRILSVRENQNATSSLLEFRHPAICFKLSRMPSDGNELDKASATLEELVAHCVVPVAHASGPAIRITENRRSIQLVAESEDERNHWLSTLCLRLAPRTFLRDRMKADIEGKTPTSKSLTSVLATAHDVFKLDDKITKRDLPGSEGESVGLSSVAQRLWKTLGTTAHSLNWTSSFGQALAGSASTVEKIATPFCQIGLVGSAFSLIALSARGVHLLATEREGRDTLKTAREDLKNASVSVCEWLVEILETGFQDDVLIGMVFDAIEECWNAAADVEQYILQNWASRVWNAVEIEAIERNVAVVQQQLLGVGVLKHVARLKKDFGNIQGELKNVKIRSSSMDEFRSSFPDPVEYSAGLLSEATTITLKQLKNRIIRVMPRQSGTNDSKGSDKVLRVAVTSVSGEGGVGKPAPVSCYARTQTYKSISRVVQFCG